MDSHFPRTCDDLFHVNLGKLELYYKISFPVWFWIRGRETRKTLVRFRMESEITAILTPWNLVELITHHGSSHTMSFHVTPLAGVGQQPGPQLFQHPFLASLNPETGKCLAIAKGTNFSCRSLMSMRLAAARDTHGFLLVLMGSSLSLLCQLHIQFSFPTALWLIQVQPRAKSSPQVPSFMW